MVEALHENESRGQKIFYGCNPQYRLAGQLWKLYVNNTAKYVVCRDGQIYMPKQKENGRPQFLNMKKLQGHLGGFFNIGVFASAKSAKFICFDIDAMDLDLVRRVIDTLVELGFPRNRIYPSVSGGKGYHVEIFSDEPVANSTLYKLYLGVIQRGGFDKHVVEFRPQQGLSVRMPLSEHYKTGETGWYCDVDTLAPIESQDYLFEIKQMQRDKFCEIVKQIKLRSNGVRKGSYRIKDPDHTYLEVVGKDDDIPMVTEPHTRHNQMVKRATYLRGCGLDQGEIYRKLMEWVDIQDRDMLESSDEEIEADARAIAEWAGGRRFTRNTTVVIRSFGHVKFGVDDLNYVLNGATKSDRRILFRSVLCQKLFGKDHAAYRVIGESMGMCEATVYKRMHKLEHDGIIKAINGVTGRKSDGGRFFRISNSYVPGDAVAQVLDHADFISMWEMGERLRWKNALWLYAVAMTTMLGANLEKYVGRREAGEIQEIIAKGRPVETDVWDDDDVVECFGPSE